jgi:hypothetical protein
MSNPSPSPATKQDALFLKLQLDVAVSVCRYLTLRDVEAMGSTCREAREQFRKLKTRQDFWGNVIPNERYLSNNWSRLSRVIRMHPEIRLGSDTVDLAMNEKGDYLFVPGLDDSLTAYRQTSATPLTFARGKRINTKGLRMVGMDNHPKHPGVYLCDAPNQVLWVWHPGHGLSIVCKLPGYSNVVAHSRNSILTLNAIQENQLIAKRYDMTEQGLVEIADSQVQIDIAPGRCCLKLSPGGYSLMMMNVTDQILQIKRFVYHSRGHSNPVSFGHILLDIARQIPNGPTLAEVLCQSRHGTDRTLHKLIPKRLANEMLSMPIAS